MRKGLFVFLSLALVVALAVPAAAELKLTGFYRVKPTTANFPIAGNAQFITSGSLSGNNTGVSTSFVEMRNRLRFEIGDENVKGITFFELDGTFGDTGGKVGRNQGFASNGDSVQLETKNAYIWFKLPDTNLTFQVGLQNYMDEFAGLLFGASDQAGVVVGAGLVTAGGRVLSVCARGRSLSTALKKSREAAEGVRFEGKHFRRDIGHQAIRMQS